MAKMYPNLYRAAQLGLVNLVADNLVATLHGTGYTPSNAHTVTADLTSELATGNGYVQGGVALANKSVNLIQAANWTTTRPATQPAVETVISASGYLWRCMTSSGAPAGTAPTFPAGPVGTLVTDGGVVWECMGTSVIQLKADPVAWANASFGPVGSLVIQDKTPTGGILVASVLFATPQNGGGGTFQETWNSQGIALLFVP